ncbi:MAG TPA: MFS transporter, partial [Steroidobacteraceae bacterium]|nr:MFS transporter [Steroidobacteraceae bacterium]
DRIGSRTALIAAAAVGALTNLAYLLAESLPAFQAIRVFEGFIMVGAYSGAPALIMATAAPERRGRAMAFWSTYTPVGVSLGLLLSAGFAGTAHWRGGYVIHLVLFAALVVAGFMLPRPPRPPAGAGQARAGLLSAWTEPGPLRLSLTFGMLVVMGFGLNTVFPSWYASQHGATMGEASSLLALGNLVMIPGGLLAGALLARGRRDYTLLVVLMLAAVVLSVPLLATGESRALRLVALAAWQFESGAAIAVVVAGLPRVVRDARQGAAAAGLLSQVAALITFVTPLIWSPILASGQWLLFVMVVAIAAVLALLLFPRAARP